MVGFVEGALLGDSTGLCEVDGETEGYMLLLGADEGSCVGPFDGVTEGMLEGELLGKDVGANVGESEGKAEGAAVGDTDGEGEAKTEGAALTVGARVILSRAKRR